MAKEKITTPPARQTRRKRYVIVLTNKTAAALKKEARKASPKPLSVNQYIARHLQEVFAS